MSLDEINAMFNTSFKLGDEVMVDRGHKSPHIGMIVGTDDCYLKLVLDGQKAVYDAVYDPEECQVIQSS